MCMRCVAGGPSEFLSFFVRIIKLSVPFGEDSVLARTCKYLGSFPRLFLNLPFLEALCSQLL